MDLHAVRTALAEAAQGTAGVELGLAYVPDSLDVWPAVYVSFAEPLEFGQTMRDLVRKATFAVTLEVPRADAEYAQRTLDQLAPAVAASLIAARKTHAAWSDLRVERADNLRRIDIGTTAYLAIDLRVIVHAPTTPTED